MNNDNDLNLHSMTRLSGWLRYWIYVLLALETIKQNSTFRAKPPRQVLPRNIELYLIVSGSEEPKYIFE